MTMKKDSKHFPFVKYMQQVVLESGQWNHLIKKYHQESSQNSCGAQKPKSFG